MKKIITAVFCTALALSSGLTAYAAEALDRDTVETAIWEDLWNGKYDTHNVNYIIMPDGSMLCSIGDKRVIKVRAEDITGNSYAYMVHDNTIVWTIQPAPMQEVLDGVYNRLVCDYQRAKNLWDLELVKRWGSLPATHSQLSYLKKLIRRSHRNDIRGKYEASVLIGQLA